MTVVALDGAIDDLTTFSLIFHTHARVTWKRRKSPSRVCARTREGKTRSDGTLIAAGASGIGLFETYNLQNS
jgi:hypothetical protein